MTSIVRLSDLPSGRVHPLVVESEAAGHAFVRRLAEEWATGRNRFDRPGEALFAALEAGRMVGVCGLNLDPYTTTPRVGRVRHLYVLSAARRLGIGARLMETIIEAAREPFDVLRLSTNNLAAARLYERLGFSPAPDVAHCTHLMALPGEPAP